MDYEQAGSPHSPSSKQTPAPPRVFRWGRPRSRSEGCWTRGGAPGSTRAPVAQEERASTSPAAARGRRGPNGRDPLPWRGARRAAERRRDRRSGGHTLHPLLPGPISFGEQPRRTHQPGPVCVYVWLTIRRLLLALHLFTGRGQPSETGPSQKRK